MKKNTEYLNSENKPLYYIEVTPPENFEYILIKNYYTSTINIVQMVNEKWKCILSDYRLMTNSDTDEEGEKNFLFNKSQLLGYTEKLVLRIYLEQESTNWKNFSLENIKFIPFTSNEQDAKTVPLFNLNNSSFEFIINGKTHSILHDKEEINQKYIEINNAKDNITFSIFK